MKKIIQLVLVLILALALVGCGKDDNGGDSQKSTALKSATVVTSKSVARVQVGHTLQCSYKVSPSNAEVASVKWAVSNALGTISETGLFTAGSEAGLVKISVEVTGKDGTVVTGTKSIQITLDEVPEYPDLYSDPVFFCFQTMAESSLQNF